MCGLSQCRKLYVHSQNIGGLKDSLGIVKLLSFSRSNDVSLYPFPCSYLDFQSFVRRPTYQTWTFECKFHCFRLLLALKFHTCLVEDWGSGWLEALMGSLHSFKVTMFQIYLLGSVMFRKSMIEWSMGIQMGANCAIFLVSSYLCSYEFKFLDGLSIF